MKQKVLLILLDEGLGRSIASALGKAGYETRAAPDRYQAINLMSEHDPDFLILDREIEDSDVILLCRSFRREMNLPAARVLLLTDDPDNNLSCTSWTAASTITWSSPLQWNN